MTTGFASLNGASIYYEVEGEGQPLVLIHSLLLHSGMWDDQMSAFSGDYKVLRYDLSGFGKSQPVTASDVDDLIALLDQLNIGSVHLVGLSIGAEIALNFTLSHPDRVKKLVLASSGLEGYEYSEISQKNWHNFITPVQNRDFATAREVFLKQVIDGPISPATPEVREHARQMMETYTFANFFPPDATESPEDQSEVQMSEQPTTAEVPIPAYKPQIERLGEIQSPTLIIVGNRDEPDTVRVGSVLAEGISNAHLVVIAGAAHIVNLEQPAAFNRIVLDFLAK
ncbi:MAG: alpha/beta hydrolase [Anaerolineae bacterium]|nr:alpha/beta hydrolase [Anaerolineae bacterium]